MISKEFATTYFMTSITGKRIIQKCKKWDWSLTRDLATRDLATQIAFIIQKNYNFDICFRKKYFIEDYYY